jgi:aldose 1-epimerase
MSIEVTPFCATSDGTLVERFRLTSSSGVEADILSFGGTLAALRAPDRYGQTGDIALGFDQPEQYLQNRPFIGVLVGRYGNRIAGGRFSLDGKSYSLARNNGQNHLHGGPGGFHAKVWAAEVSDTPDGPAVVLRYTSPDGEEGYPGALSVTVSYTLSETGALTIDYRATTDQPTVLNLTNHAYFNLAGSGDILGHELELRASRFLPTDAGLIPTGELRPVQGTPMDFTTLKRIGAEIGADDEQLRLAGGYDHTWVLDQPTGSPEIAARVFEPVSGRLLEVLTTQPGVQFYAGNQLDGSIVGRQGQRYTRHAGLCLETQHFPDSPNQPSFPSTVLRPGETYHEVTVFHPRLG